MPTELRRCQFKRNRKTISLLPRIFCYLCHRICRYRFIICARFFFAQLRLEAADLLIYIGRSLCICKKSSCDGLHLSMVFLCSARWRNLFVTSYVINHPCARNTCVFFPVLCKTTWNLRFDDNASLHWQFSMAVSTDFKRRVLYFRCGRYVQG